MRNPTAAMIVIGDEILSGRTKDINLNVIAKTLCDVGIDLKEARFIVDQREEIIDAVHALRHRYDDVFTSGGIGPTHDDITADSIAEAFGVPISIRDDARQILALNYPNGLDDLTPARLRMARIPQGAMLIDNPISRAPGFSIQNVHVMAGIPEVFKAMLEGLLPRLRKGEALHSKTIKLSLPESAISEFLGEVAARYPAISIGSYPFYEGQNYGANIVLRGHDKDALEAAFEEIERKYI